MRVLVLWMAKCSLKKDCRSKASHYYFQVWGCSTHPEKHIALKMACWKQREQNLTFKWVDLRHEVPELWGINFCSLKHHKMDEEEWFWKLLNLILLTTYSVRVECGLQVGYFQPAHR